ncbi:hypothetical protein SAMN05444414_11680 [Roseovarius marisflavi]|uniref:Uncharacterized protein n=2 Tax=Roseovarius marisflavi TaxID=1054996 RepID=A0A1M7B682_9RHOB|nr:hypothetical protein SAMN05444414_11680 [Roseovarius marisflavi]
MTPGTIDRMLMALIATTLAASVVIAVVDPTYFHRVFAAEDHLVENATALFLLIAGLVLARNALSLRKRGQWRAMALTGLYAAMFVFAAGEEISWGQRIFGWQSGAFFTQNNYQGETNLHNLMIGDLRLAQAVFGGPLTVAILLYLVVFPLLYPRVRFIRALADRLAAPVPGMRHAGFAVLGSVIIGLLDVPRKWEVYELVFALMATSTFLLPQNPDKTRQP